MWERKRYKLNESRPTRRVSNPSGHTEYYVVYECDKRVISSKLFLNKREAEDYAKDIEHQGKKIRGIEEYGY